MGRNPRELAPELCLTLALSRLIRHINLRTEVRIDMVRLKRSVRQCNCDWLTLSNFFSMVKDSGVEPMQCMITSAKYLTRQ
ncbi:hypothetical protein LINPERHAP1_LOCUS39688 [Linum perenne]